MPDRARTLRAVATGTLVCVLLTACADPPPEPPTLTEAVLGYVDQSFGDTGGDYAEPRPRALADLPRAVLALADGEPERARDLLRRHDYRVREIRGFSVVVPVDVPDGRGWGLFAVRPPGRPVVVEVPHPRSDRSTERMGAALAARLSAQHLLVAGARRDADGGRADVAHQDASVFTALHAALAERGLPAVQLHGFAPSSSPGHDVVVSPGSAALSPLVRQVARALDEAGYRTCRAWREDCGPLEGRTNSQAAASAAAGSAFVHVEVAAPLRTDARAREALVDVLTSALRRAVPLRSDP